MTDAPRPTLGELALVFLRLGATAFGGPAAHIAMMEVEVVGRRGWLSRERFLDLLGAANLIPGPNSTEMAIFIGRDQRGVLGLLVAGACFIVPAVVIVMALAWAYVRYGTLPAAEGLLYGVKPVILAVIAQALWTLGKTAIKTWQLGVIAGWAIAAIAFGMNELLVLVIAGSAAIAFTRAHRGPAASVLPFLPVTAVAATAAGAAPFSLAALFGFFAKVGALLYGSGYVLIAFLRTDLVLRWHWLTEAQLLDAVAIGQVTPGPVFTTATFIGYLLDGPQGALVATAGIFLPAFVFVAIGAPLVPRIRRSPTAGAFLDGVTVASLALMAWAGLELGRSTLVDVQTIAVAVIAAAILFRYKVNATWLVAGGAVLGVIRAQL
ncbi:MAG: chromate transporter [Deltaproteobacteria bacterium]|nr:chromate transporter [Deltaproteobacteria bacterium]